jgi:hypothetical protein
VDLGWLLKQAALLIFSLFFLINVITPGSSHGEHAWGDDMQWTPSSKQRFANEHLSDSDVSYVHSPVLQSPGSWSSSD